jgi:hypothetical protein
MSSLTKITHEDLKQKLNQGSVKFYFRKVGGELRIALGTLDLNRLPQDKIPKGGKKPGNATAYYDLEKGQWRSVSETQEIWID